MLNRSPGSYDPARGGLLIDERTQLMQEADSLGQGLRLLVSGRELGEGRLVELSQSFAVVGGSRAAEVTLASSKVSFRHAYLQVLDGHIFCVDLGSKGGIFWGKERRDWGWIAPTQAVRIGPYTLQVLSDAPVTCLGAQDEGLPNPLAEGGTVAFPQFTLEFFDDSLAEAVHLIDRRITLIGRHRKCAVRLDDPSVSRVHCALVLARNGLWLVDLLGKEGTRLDGQKIRFGPVEVGSQLTVGVYSMSAWQHKSAPRKAAIEASPAVNLSASPTGKPDVSTLEWVGTLFAVEHHPRALIIVPTISGGMFRQSKLQSETNALRWKLDALATHRLVIDLHALDYIGAEAIRAVVGLARHIEEMEGRVALCCATPRLQEVLTKMGLCRIWPLYPTRETALAAVEGR